ncbi:MAG: DUF1292 domain-containing protein [Lachnospiraceae bacterium]|nr:DUF1292 domain-containing protein [Lachnospiraceae bacterium]
MEKIKFFDADSNEESEFYVLEETTLGGENYILVTDKDPEDEEAVAFVLHRTKDVNEEFYYEPVEDGNTLDAVLAVFEELLDDVGFEEV